MVKLESGRVVGVAAAYLWYNLAGGVKPEMSHSHECAYIKHVMQCNGGGGYRAITACFR